MLGGDNISSVQMLHPDIQIFQTYDYFRDSILLIVLKDNVREERFIKCTKYNSLSFEELDSIVCGMYEELNIRGLIG